MTVKTIKMTCKVSDMFSFTAQNEEGAFVGEYQGYVPKEIFGYGGDYIDLTIDISTGKIIGWKEPTQENINAILTNDDIGDDNMWV